MTSVGFHHLSPCERAQAWASGGGHSPAVPMFRALGVEGRLPASGGSSSRAYWSPLRAARAGTQRQGWDGWYRQEASQLGALPTSPCRTQPAGARRAQDMLKNQPHWYGRRAGACPCLPWHLHAWGLSTGQAFPHQNCAPLQKEPEIQLYKYQCRR